MTDAAFVRQLTQLHQGMSDAVALERLETLIATQQPASVPWQPVTDYSFEARKQIEGIHPQLIQDVFQPQRVLDVGCGPDAILVRLLRQIGVMAAGCDVQIRKPHARYLFAGDVTDDSIQGPPHDLVISRECLEHLTMQQIRRAVTTLCRLSSRFVYVTTRYAKAPDHLLDVDTSDDLDPDHRTMLNQSFLRLLFVLEGFKRRADLEAKMDHKGYGRVLVYERA